MLIVGLTGSFGSGKSTIARMFKEAKAVVIDADEVTRKLLAPGGKCVKKVAKVFGHAILELNQIDRAVLAKKVFQDPRELTKLTNILYPAALQDIKKQIAQHKNTRLIVLEVPQLFESGWDKLTQVNIVVQSNQKTQIQRLQKKLKTSKADILRRMKNQMPLKEKLNRADIVIDNRGTLPQTRAQVRAIIHRLNQIRK